MSEDMNLSVNGHSKVPPGFRFHPTEEELLHYYLTKKVSSQKIDLDVIRDVDLNKLEPWDIQERCKIGSTPQNDWYFFSHKDKKYPTGTRTNRATAAGFWKATGRDKVIHSSSRRIGMRKTLVFYRGRAPHGQKSDWIMHEYRLDLDDDNNTTPHESTAYNNASNLLDSGSDEGWVVCRVFKKKNYHKSIDSPSASINLPRNEGVLDHILMYMGRSSNTNTSSWKQENDIPASIFAGHQPTTPGFMHLPSLESPTFNPPEIGPSSDWAAVDRLVASQLNGQPSKQFGGFGGSVDEELTFCFDHRDEDEEAQILVSNMMNNSDKGVANGDHLWSSSDPLCHLSV